jgi:hypothetical protein
VQPGPVVLVKRRLGPHQLVERRHAMQRRSRVTCRLAARGAVTGCPSITFHDAFG